MIADAMEGWRNPARYLAPLALAAVVAATYLIVHHALVHKHSTTTPTVPRRSTVDHRHGAQRGPSKAKFYVVKPGDTLSAIAAKTGVSMATLESAEPAPEPERPSTVAAAPAAAMR